MYRNIDISIITVNYNGLDDTCSLINSIPCSNPYRTEVIVVDNASRNNEAAILAQRYPWIKVIRSQQNLGFAGGNNLGIKSARGKYLLFINNDTTISRINFEALVGRLESSEKIGGVSPKIRFSLGDRHLQYAGYTQLSPITLRNMAIGFGEQDHGQYDKAHPTPYLHGAAMLVKRSAIDKAGNMPVCYFLYYEELDWSVRLREAGYKLWYEPGCVVFHKESQSTGMDSPLKNYYSTRSRLLFACRNLPAHTVALSIGYQIAVAIPVNILRQLRRKRFDNARSVLRGLLHFIFKITKDKL